MSIQISISNSIKGSSSSPTGVAPSNVIAPLISGVTVVGYSLSTTNGSWVGESPITYTYQWYRGATLITGATSSSYTLVNADEGQSMTCVVTATNAYGFSSATSNSLTVVSLLLDLYTNSAVAYSLRKLRTAYTGNAIRVRRSSDNAEQDINFVGGDLDTQSLLDFVGYNLFTYSEDISQAVFTKQNLNITGTPPYVNVETAPDGTLTGDKIIEDTNNTTHYVGRSATLINSTSYNISVYLKQAERTKVQIFSNISGSSQTCDVDLTNGNISNNGFANTPVVTAEANGWYRFSVTITSGTTSANGIRVFLTNGSTTTYLGNGTSGAYVWGFQLSQTSSVKTYEKTEATASGNGFITTWYDQSGNANNATQTTIANQGQIVSSGSIVTDPNTGKISVIWSTDFYLFTGIALTQLMTMSTVVNRVTTSGTLYPLVTSGATNPRLYGWGSTGTASSVLGGTTVTHETSTTIGAYIMSALRDGSNVVKAWKNTTALTTGTASSTTGSFTSFGQISATGTTGRIVEMIFWDNDKESSRADIVTNQNDYWEVY